MIGTYTVTAMGPFAGGIGLGVGTGQFSDSFTLASSDAVNGNIGLVALIGLGAGGRRRAPEATRVSGIADQFPYGAMVPGVKAQDVKSIIGQAGVTKRQY